MKKIKNTSLDQVDRLLISFGDERNALVLIPKGPDVDSKKMAQEVIKSIKFYYDIDNERECIGQ